MIKYVIFEIQTDQEGHTVHLPPINIEGESEAWAVFYEKLAYAIRSTVYMHTVMLCTTDGRRIDGKSYVHGSVPEVEE